MDRDEGGGGWFEMTAESHNSERSLAGGAWVVGDGRRELVRGERSMQSRAVWEGRGGRKPSQRN